MQIKESIAIIRICFDLKTVKMSGENDEFPYC